MKRAVMPAVYTSDTGGFICKGVLAAMGFLALMPAQAQQDGVVATLKEVVVSGSRGEQAREELALVTD
ncbi:MAG: hypothetical protein Q7U75_18710, partial [Desulfobacterales bacterium]|nr:hypothetical protein [Desulfobacterales bacterium]